MPRDAEMEAQTLLPEGAPKGLSQAVHHALDFLHDRGRARATDGKYPGLVAP